MLWTQNSFFRGSIVQAGRLTKYSRCQLQSREDRHLDGVQVSGNFSRNQHVTIAAGFAGESQVT